MIEQYSRNFLKIVYDLDEQVHVTFNYLAWMHLWYCLELRQLFVNITNKIHIFANYNSLCTTVVLYNLFDIWCIPLALSKRIYAKSYRSYHSSFCSSSDGLESYIWIFAYYLSWCITFYRSFRNLQFVHSHCWSLLWDRCLACATVRLFVKDMEILHIPAPGGPNFHVKHFL